MKFHTTLFHRFESDGVQFAYVTSTAAVVQLDDVTSEIIENFSDPRGAEPGPWLETLEAEREALVVDAEQVQDRRLEVPDVDRVFDDVVRRWCMNQFGTRKEPFGGPTTPRRSLGIQACPAQPSGSIHCTRLFPPFCDS